MVRRLVILLLGLCVGVSACSGGGTTSTLPSAPAKSAAAGTARVTLNIKIPAPPTGAAAVIRRPLYVSQNTQSAAIAVNGAAPVVVNLAAGSPACVTTAGVRTCSVAVNAPVGADTFAETLYASTDGSGAPLSQSTTAATITAGIANVVNLALDGVVATITLALANAAPSAGSPASINLTVNVLDASGAAIIGPDPFANPIALTDSDTSGATTLSKTTLLTPSDAANLTVAYTGGALVQAVIGASATGAAAANVTLVPVVAFNDYTTFGYDNGRDAFNPNSTAITPAAIPSLHLAMQTAVGDYSTQTQPILATEIPGHAAVLFVGGGSGHVYAVDAQTGAAVWQQYLGQLTYSGCGTGTDYFGVGGTAAYDPATKSLYIVGTSNTTLNGFSAVTLFRIDAGSGTILGKTNVTPTAAGSSEQNFGHTAVTLSNGTAYVGTGSTCDLTSWRGRVAAVSVPAMTLTKTFFTVWDPQNARGYGSQPWSGGGIWGWGGVSLDPAGNVLTGVGNTDTGLSSIPFVSPFQDAPLEYSGFGETLLELSGNLSNVVASNHPIAPSTYNAVSDDLDVQGTPLVFTPQGAGCGTMIALQSKAGTLSLYNENSISSGPVQQYTLSPSAANDAYLGEPAYSAATGLVYAPVESSVSPSLYNPGLIAITPGCGKPSVAWHSAFGTDASAAQIPRSVPAVSAGGVVFAGSASGNGGALWAIDAGSGTPLNNGVPLLYTPDRLRVPPTIDGKWVFVIDNSGNVYGLTLDPNFKTITAKLRAPDARSRPVWNPRPKN